MYEISFANLLLYNSVIPEYSYSDDKDKGKVEMSFNNPQKDIADKVSSTKQKAETSKAKEEKRPQKQSEKTAQKETAKKSKGRKV